jgi:hypothetical protein
VDNDAVDTLDLQVAGRVVVEKRAEDERGTERGVQLCPEGAGEARVAVRHQHVQKPHVAEDRRNDSEFARRSFRSGCLEGGDEPDAVRQEVDVHLHWSCRKS